MTELTHDGLQPTDKDRAETRRGPAGDARPNENDPDPRTGGGQPQEDVEDRPGVSTVTPEDYPEDQRAKG